MFSDLISSREWYPEQYSVGLIGKGHAVDQEGGGQQPLLILIPFESGDRIMNQLMNRCEVVIGADCLLAVDPEGV